MSEIKKPVVEYSGKPVVKPWVWNPEYTVAHLEKVYNHPHLGNEVNVRTSEVVSFDPTTNVIETLNTIYIQRKE